MQTLARERVLGALDPKAFDVIIIDEVHRAAAESYRKIMAHFEPKLWFGMTASPTGPTARTSTRSSTTTSPTRSA